MFHSLIYSFTHLLYSFISIKYENKITTHGDLSAIIANEVKSQMIELSQLKGTDKSQYPPGMVHSLIRHLLTHSFIQYSKKYTRG